MLIVDSVSKNFGGLRALSEISFEVKKGETVGIIGPNGSGKTTLFQIISGFYNPSKGRIFFKGKRIDGIGPSEVCKRGIGRTFQVVQPFPSFTVYETVLVAALGRHRMASAHQRTREILDLVGLASKSDWPSQNITLVEHKILELARALATEPDLILLDEVMSGLLPSEMAQAINLIVKLRSEGITFLIIEHIMKAIKDLCTHVIVLDFGQEIAKGSTEEIYHDRKVIEAYLGKGEYEFTCY